MSQLIRCEPLPFPLVSEKGAAGDASLFPLPGNSLEGSSDFDDVLASELEEDRKASKQKAKPETDALAVYGVALTVQQVLENLVPAAVVEAQFGTGGEVMGVEAEGSQTGCLRYISPDSATGIELVDPSGAKQINQLVRALRLGEQKVPFSSEELSAATEQIAEIGPEPVKKASGIVAAQGASMLLSSQRQEETAPGQDISISMESIEAGAFEESFQYKPGASRESAPRRDLELAEFSATDALAPEWSSFEGISESSDLQASKRVDLVDVAETIRTHVELLKTSGPGKLDVVLRPDGQTELHLHVEKVNGQILVQARCDRGDFSRLEANWAAVQHTLANQGVRVESLQNGAQFQQHNQHWQNGENGSSSFQQQSSSKQEKFPLDPKFENPKGTRSSSTSSGAVRGWQSWA